MKNPKLLILSAALVTFASLNATEVLVEGKAGYFGPTDKTFRDIYGGGAIYGVELSCQTWNPLYLWTSGSYFTKSGHSIGERDGTHITLVPIALGLKYMRSWDWFEFYLGAGALTTYLHVRNHSPFVIESQSKWGIGGIAKAGFLFDLTRSVFLDVFGDYSYMKIRFHNTHGGTILPGTANVSGWSVGGGIGYRFGCP